MTREDKCLLAISKGYTYDKDTGIIYGVRGNKIINKTTGGYIATKIRIGKKSIDLKGHQFAWYYTYGSIVDEIDHINGVKDDNRICNLRSITHQENMWNQTNTKGYYYKKQNKKWVSKIGLNGKYIHLGYFFTKEEAQQAYLEAKKLYHIIN